MATLRRFLILPLLLAAAAAAPAPAAEVRDAAGMFSPEAVRRAETELNRIERRSGVPVTIETIESLRGATTAAERQAWRAKKAPEVATLLAERRAADVTPGAYLLISKKDRALSSLLVERRYADRIAAADRRAVRDAMIAGFKAGDFDAGLLDAVDRIGQSLDASRGAAGAPARAARPAPGPAPRRGFSMGWLVVLGIIVLVAIVVVRGLGRLLGGGRPQPGGPPGGHGGPVGRGIPGAYGGPGGYGYGRGGGGFLSGLFGGLGGALLGNWAYDHLGRHHDSGTPPHSPGHAPPVHDPGPDWVGADDPGASWGEPEPGGWTGGDSGGGDAGGGDWGGGGGGGDWGGGESDGGSW